MKPETIARKIADYFHAEMLQHQPGSPKAKMFACNAIGAESVVLCLKKPSYLKFYKQPKAKRGAK